MVVPNSLVFRAEGEALTFTAITQVGVVPVIGGTANGFTVNLGSPSTMGGVDVTPITVTAPDNTGNRDPRVGEVKVSVTGSDRTATVTLNQRQTYVDNIIP